MITRGDAVRRVAGLGLCALGGAAVVLLFQGTGASWFGRNARTAGERVSSRWIERAEAAVGKGDYLFFPCRREMWVVNRANGKMVHYQFFDTEHGTVERSRIAAIDQGLFPLTDTDFLLSDRNLNSYLWVVNRSTGDFKLYRSTRDGNLTTDTDPVPAGEHLRAEPSESKRPDRPATAGTRRPPPPEEPPPERTGGKKRAESSRPAAGAAKKDL